MSYCRFSCDDHRSDLYVYPAADGWTVHVAARRAIIDRSSLPAVDADLTSDDWPEQWLARHRALTALLSDAEWVDITLPHAGTTGLFESPGEAADAIEWLAALGYHVPDGVIDALRSEVT